jgi:MFS family permease
MLFTNNSTLIAINGLAGLALAPHAGLATLPVTCWILGGAIGTMPASLHMRRVGRQRGFTLGTIWGFVGALVCAAAIALQSFWLLCLGTLVWGVYNAYGQYYRFAAADAASADFKPMAISLVLAGGLVGGVLGPNVSRFTIDLGGTRFLGASPRSSSSRWRRWSCCASSAFRRPPRRNRRPPAGRFPRSRCSRSSSSRCSPARSVTAS